MQQLKVEHKKIPTKTTSNQKVVGSKQTEELVIENKRDNKGRNLAISRRIYRLSNSDVYYVESESSDDIYYFVKFKPDVLEWCSCKDNSTRHLKCKHLFAIEFAIKCGTIKDIDKIPLADTNQNSSNNITTKAV